jgi:NAD-dependent histone deacetylase SIR2
VPRSLTMNPSNWALVPDFRSSTGLFATLRNQHNLKSSGKHLFDASVYRNDSSTSSFHDMVRELSHLTQNAQPTLFHHMIATLAEEGRLLRLYTQNVDGIDTSLEPLATKVPLNVKGPWPKTIQLHGGLEKMVCSKCGDLSDFNGALFEGPEPPSCPRCEEIDDTRRVVGLRSHGIGRLRPRMVLYNEFNPDEEAIGAVSASDLAKRPDAVIVVGTSLKVPGIRRLAKEMCAVTRGRRGGFTAWINHDPEPVGVEFKDCWELVVRGECDDVSRHVDLPRWFDKDVGEFSIVTSEEDKAKKGLVGLEIRPLEFVKAQAMPTPGASPREQSPSAMDTKLKQAQLPFTVNGVFGQKAQKVRKKPGRKPKHPLAATSKITKAFNTSKGTKATKSKPTPLELFPNLPQEPSAMRQVSPVDHRINSEMVWHENCIDKVKSGPPRPVTPIRETKEYDREETISPKGRVPFGMEKLIS